MCTHVLNWPCCGPLFQAPAFVSTQPPRVAHRKEVGGGGWGYNPVAYMNVSVSLLMCINDARRRDVICNMLFGSLNFDALTKGLKMGVYFGRVKRLRVKMPARHCSRILRSYSWFSFSRSTKEDWKMRPMWRGGLM